MPRFAANLTMLFNEIDFIARFKYAAKFGFKEVEYLFPYDYESDELVEQLQLNKLKQVLHNLPAGDWEAGDRGIACIPDRIGEFQDGVGRAIEYATALDCPQVNCLAGIPDQGVDADTSRRTLINNLKFAAANLHKANIRLLIEPVNTQDIPGFFLNRTSQARSIIDEVGSNNLWLQYDIYHMQIMEGNLLPTIKANLDIIKHLQLADTPGRNEPGTGEINYPFLFNQLDTLGYDGWIGCEYKPATTTEAGLGWARKYLNE